MTVVAISLDLGSTSIKAGLLDKSGKLQGVVSRPVPPLQIDGNRYESDALAYAEIADAVLQECLENATMRPPLGICCQRSSFVIWERTSGKPVTPLISWQDARGAESCDALRLQEAEISRLTGLRLTPYYFAPKLRVLLSQHPGWRDRLLSGEWLAGTLDTFLIWRWTDGACHITDVSMAARTLLMDINTLQWSRRLCELFDIPHGVLPKICKSTGMQIRLKNGLQLQATVADQSAALSAIVGMRSDVVLVNLGTGGFVIRALNQEQQCPVGYLRTLLHHRQGKAPQYACEGTLNSIASALAPYPVNLCEPAQLGGHSGIYCTAEPSGIGAPYFRKFPGLQFSESVEGLAQTEIAVLLIEAIIFRVVRIIREFDRVSPVHEVYLSGGLSEVQSIQQGLAQSLSQPFYRMLEHEASLQGAAVLASALQAEVEVPKQLLQFDTNNLLVEKYNRWEKWLDSLIL